MELFAAQGVSKSFSNHLALKDVSISVPEQSIYGLLGPNGAGKTTLIRIINQITAPDSGKLLFKGKKLAGNDIRYIGYMPEERGLYKKMKVGEQAVYLARLKGLSKKDALKRVKYWFEKFEITDWWNKKVEELSKGMQQKVQFIITILHEPSLLIFDEPFSGFDPVNTETLKNEVLELRKRGATIIFSTHNMGSVEELCDHITLIDNAESILSGKMTDIKQKFKLGIFEISFEGDSDEMEKIISEGYRVISMKKTGSINTARIKIDRTVSNNELLKILMPHFHIISFSELLPGMNDIFIDLVSKQKKKPA